MACLIYQTWLFLQQGLTVSASSFGAISDLFAYLWKLHAHCLLNVNFLYVLALLPARLSGLLLLSRKLASAQLFGCLG